MQLSSGNRKLAPAMLFFGCRSPDQDDIYRSQLDEWEGQGAVEVFRSFSRDPEKSEGCKHVDDMMMKHKDRLIELWKQGAKVYVCGSRGVSESVKEAIIKLRMEIESSDDEAETRKWFDGLRNVRYVTDVFD